jgi:PAS domain S-box-containing protein
MYDQRRTKAQLYEELAALRARVAELEQARADLPSAGVPSDQRRLHDSPDTRERQRAEHALEGQRRFFEQLATGAPLATVLDILVRTLEGQIEGGRCSIMLLDEHGQHLHNGAAPSLPPAYVSAIEGSAIGPAVGSCGTAAYRGEPVIVADIASDPLWVDYRELALSHGLRACWSVPFSDSRERVLGTLVVYYAAPRAPIAAELDEVKQAAYLASVAVERTRAEAALRISEQRHRLVSRATNDVIWDWDIVHQRLEWNECAQTLFGYTAEDVGCSPLWWDEHLHPDDRARASASVQAVLESGGQFWSGEYRFRRADQSYAHVLDRG